MLGNSYKKNPKTGSTLLNYLRICTGWVAIAGMHSLKENNLISISRPTEKGPGSGLDVPKNIV